jgi:aryl-alcohol dehydrogenase-like predicted oxidoreductase
MKYKKLGTTNLEVSSICLGSMTFGEQNSQSQAFEQMNYATERGVNFFDTAEMYPIYPKRETSGKSEEIIGQWLKTKKNREKIILASKVASGHPKGIGAHGLAWIRKGGKSLRFDKKNMITAVNDSLKRLQTDYIDLYQLHWPERNVAVFGQLDFKYDPSDTNWTPIEEVLENLDYLVKLGKIRYVGLSNETPWGIINFLKIAKEKRLPRMMSIQNGYSLVNRVFDIANSEVSMQEQCGLLAYSPLAGGRLSGKYINEKKPKNSRFTLWPQRFSRHHTKRGELAITKYVNLAKKYDILPSTFANAFVANRPFVTSNVIGATSIKHLEENINSIDITFTNEMEKDIEDIHSSDPNPCV